MTDQFNNRRVVNTRKDRKIRRLEEERKELKRKIKEFQNSEESKVRF